MRDTDHNERNDMDLPGLNALLKVNGYSSASSPEDIKGVLLKCGYLEKEIPQALAILGGKPPPEAPSLRAPAALVAPIIERTRTATHVDYTTSPFMGRIGVQQFWAASVPLLVLCTGVFFAVQISAVPLFTIITGLSLFSPPFLATAPLRVFLLLGIEVIMVIVPVIFIFVPLIGLQIRRFHDFGVSSLAWFGVWGAVLILGYIMVQSPALALFVPFLAPLIIILTLSIPGSKEDNEFGMPMTYPSLWAAMLGSQQESGHVQVMARRIVAPIIYVEALAIVCAGGLQFVLSHGLNF